MWYNIWYEVEGVNKALGYNEDLKWEEAKKTARLSGFQNQWIEIIDHYNSNDGEHVQIFCVIDGIKYRIAYILDDNRVLLITKNNGIQTKDYDEVNESQKLFFYKEETKEQNYILEEGQTFYTQASINIYI